MKHANVNSDTRELFVYCMNNKNQQAMRSVVFKLLPWYSFHTKLDIQNLSIQ